MQGLQLILRSSESVPIQADLRGYRVYSGDLGNLPSLTLIQAVGYSKAVIFFYSKSVLEFIGSNRFINSNYII